MRKKMGTALQSLCVESGRHWDDRDGTVKVFLEKDGKRKEVEVHLRVEGGMKRFWLEERTTQPHQEKERRDDNETRPVVEVVPVMSEVDPEEKWVDEMITLTE